MHRIGMRDPFFVLDTTLDAAEQARAEFFPWDIQDAPRAKPPVRLIDRRLYDVVPPSLTKPVLVSAGIFTLKPTLHYARKSNARLSAVPVHLRLHGFTFNGSCIRDWVFADFMASSMT